jgi:hypothetical protein
MPTANDADVDRLQKVGTTRVFTDEVATVITEHFELQSDQSAGCDDEKQSRGSV